jgi:hypothetical protein
LDLVLLNDFLEFFSVDALSLVIAENHGIGHLHILGVILLVQEFLNAIAIYLELLFMRKFALSIILIARDNRVKVKDILVRGLQVREKIMVGSQIACQFV